MLDPGATSDDGCRTEPAQDRQFRLNAQEGRELLTVVAAGRGEVVAAVAIKSFDPEPFVIPDVVKSAEPVGTVTVQVLGSYRIVVRDREVDTGLRTTSRELLALLMLYPAGKTAEAIIDKLWPDSEPAKGAEAFKTAVANLRKVLRRALGETSIEVIERVGGRYRAAPSVVACDLWRFEMALADAGKVQGEVRALALQTAVREYGGDLLDGTYYQWAEAACEGLRRRAVDALVELAELAETDGDVAGAVSVSEQALGIDPYAEDLYRRLIKLNLDLGRPDAARRALRRLNARLTELGADPDPRTLAVVARIPQGRQGISDFDPQYPPVR